MKKDLSLILLGMFLMAMIIFNVWEHKRITALENFANQIIRNSQRQTQRPIQPAVKPEEK